jgi:hypothetical protein
MQFASAPALRRCDFNSRYGAWSHITCNASPPRNDQPRHCERSEAIQGCALRSGLLRRCSSQCGLHRHRSQFAPAPWIAQSVPTLPGLALLAIATPSRTAWQCRRSRCCARGCRTAVAVVVAGLGYDPVGRNGTEPGPRLHRRDVLNHMPPGSIALFGGVGCGCRVPGLQPCRGRPTAPPGGDCGLPVGSFAAAFVCSGRYGPPS